MALFIDSGIYGDGDIYESNVGTPLDFVAEQEVHGHRVSVRINYTAAVIPGEGEAFRVHDIRLRDAPDRQGSFTHEAFIDAITPSTHVSAKVKHSGSEFILSHMQLIAQRKKHQPIG